ncbi:MAG: hypothetical protein K5838_03895 [Elusimicrobiales bacterium]|nr:hypothetical protein [Elusimicrobiales bacterium]
MLTLFQFQAVSAEDTKNIQTEISGAENSLSNAAGNNESAAAEQVGLSDVNDNEIAPDDDDDFSDSLMKLNMQVSASQISATINSKRGEMQLDGMDINRFLPKITKKAKTAGKTKKNKGKKEITAQNKAQKEYQPEKNDNGDIPRMKNPKTLADLFGGNNIQYGGQLINRNVCIPCLNINAGMKKTMLKRIMVKDKSSLKGIVK